MFDETKLMRPYWLTKAGSRNIVIQWADDSFGYFSIFVNWLLACTNSTVSTAGMPYYICLEILACTRTIKGNKQQKKYLDVIFRKIITLIMICPSIIPEYCSVTQSKAYNTLGSFMFSFIFSVLEKNMRSDKTLPLLINQIM